ncbi:hypothetical protein CPT_Moby_077 [Stenotrophomonas phage Moby]|uniref:Uncharacterized protein n=2 Tax=Menderavirus TaxID=2843421 RepID=A0A5P8PME6_9CAUD|nr:hypothetical protein HWC58_gp077 [Stenotrophomonas phage Moby]YP_010667654.1 hypothetical protein PQC01_gp175 [Stenotrophomonas maltophilia phage vB_SmaM_Ps15]QFR57825.1 hypothetical protein CPT_Moby_077 [Stenotrophomonas phage Moby]UMO77326.1 hypothetical protein SmaMPs15_000175 [Stenotrophomonas maltophilia phage vB_SmaM_Ps15]
MATVAETKAAILAKLAGGNAWAKGATARDANDLPCPALSGEAVKWDIYGALLFATKDEPNYSLRNNTYFALKDAIPADYKNRDIESYNDDATWAQLSAILS